MFAERHNAADVMLNPGETGKSLRPCNPHSSSNVDQERSEDRCHRDELARGKNGSKSANKTSVRRVCHAESRHWPLSPFSMPTWKMDVILNRITFT